MNKFKLKKKKKRRLSAEELMFSNCDAGEDSQSLLDSKEDQTSQC